MVCEVLLPWSWLVTTLLILATVCMAFKTFIGDTLQFRRCGGRVFIQERFARYGDPFTTSIMGKKYVVVNSSEAVKFVLSKSEDTGFSVLRAKSAAQLLSEGKFVASQSHAHFRRATLASLSGDAARNLYPFVSSLAERTVKSWVNQAVVNTVEEMEKYTFEVMMHMAWKDVEVGSEKMDQIRHELHTLLRGLKAVPINLPGFTYHKSVKARRVLVSLMLKSIAKRREANIELNDFLNNLLKITEIEVPDYDICCIMVVFMFAATDTTSALISWVVKYLHDFPEVRQRVQDEQDSVREKMVEDKSLTWFKPKSSMPYTLQVIYEILRVETLVPFLPRTATTDINFKGFVFPKGSNVWASTSSVQLNPENYRKPLEFDPSRFEKEKPNPNTFIPFGGGPHLCTGSELALAETMLFVHHLVTNYSFKRFGPEIQSRPSSVIPKPAGGFPIVVERRMTPEAR